MQRNFRKTNNTNDMKKIILSSLALLVMFSATAQNYKKGDPNKPGHTYLNDYAPLKTYIDRAKYPNFKLGIGTTVSDYLSNGTVKGLTEENFNETVAGNAMKMQSCVDANGTMNFSTVSNYVNAATSAGLSVYGHTLAWHSQQANGWLRSLIKDKAAKPFDNPDVTVLVNLKSKDFRSDRTVGWHSDYTQYSYGITFDTTNGMKVTNTKNQSYWLVQYIAMSDIPTESGKTYKVTMTVKGSKAGTLAAKLGDWNNGATKNFSFTTDWKDISMDYTADVASAFLLLQSGSFVGDIYIRNIKVEEPVGAKKVMEPNQFIKVAATAKKSNAWDNQFWVVSPTTFASGTKYSFSARIRADKPAKVSTQIHSTPGTYVDSQALGDLQFGTVWNTINIEGTFAKEGKSIAFNLNELADANTYYFDDISLKIGGVEKISNGNIEGTDLSCFKMKLNNGGTVTATTGKEDYHIVLPQSTPLTMDEKRVILTDAMDQWISGMMKACNGKVKAWDVVNEAISGGGNDGAGNYTLQHSNGYNNSEASWDVGGDSFYWQDHMGDLDYVRTAVRLARKYGPADVKLFINDYNLESDWDSNKKLASLINWIAKWESDGVTKLDGIGTQMHISYYENSATQTSKKNAITRMFTMMANTGKLVRVSELDMGYVNASNKTLTTSELTDAQHKNMADFYEWIIKEYLRIIPASQQWGICQWCPTDAPGSLGSGWRGGEPVGIWDLNYYRKHVYAGFANGLSNQGTDGIEDIVSDKTCLSSHGIYTINGVRLPSTTNLTDLPSGLYIINGKKVMK